MLLSSQFFKKPDACHLQYIVQNVSTLRLESFLLYNCYVQNQKKDRKTNKIAPSNIFLLSRLNEKFNQLNTY